MRESARAAAQLAAPQSVKYRLFISDTIEDKIEIHAVCLAVASA